jgi:hypothetical protein
MRLFQKPKPNGKMPKSEDIFRDPKELEALKSKVKPEEYLKTLYDKIEEKEKAFEALSQDYSNKDSSLAADFDRRKAEKEALIKIVDSTLEIKRSKRDEVERPLIDIQRGLQEQSQRLEEREKQIPIEQQKVFEREREAEKKLTDVQSLSDQLGETRVRLMVKEQTLEGREKALKHNENKILLGFEELAKKRNEVQSELLVREEEVTVRELTLQGKEENLVKREKELLDGHIWLNDQRGVLARAWSELQNKIKQNGTTSTTASRHTAKRP